MRHLASVLAFLLLPGCTGSAGPYDAALDPEAQRLITRQDSVAVKVTATPGTDTGSIHLERLAQVIRTTVDRHKLKNRSSGSPRRFALAVMISRYDAGNAAALPGQTGLGQTHIDGSLFVTDPDDIARGHGYRDRVADGDTFAWGRMYQASTAIETIERDFAESLASQVVDGK